MKLSCHRERLILQGVRAGTLAAELRRHAVDCPVCSAALRLAPLFLASRAPASAAVSPQETLAAWNRARAADLLAVETAARRHAAAPLRALHLLATLAGWLLACLVLFALTGLLLAEAPRLGGLLPGLATTTSARGAGIGWLAVLASLVLVVAAAASLQTLRRQLSN